MNEKQLRRNQKGVSYAKWGYLFILPFFVAYFIFNFAPQVLTIYNSFFENYREGLKQVGPNFVGFDNYGPTRPAPSTSSSTPAIPWPSGCWARFRRF